MPVEWWLSLIAAMLAIAVSPGNGAILSMRYGLKGGAFYATPAIIGLQIGLIGVYGLVLCSLMITSKISPRTTNVIALVGGLYLIYLGGKDIWAVRYHPASTSKLMGEMNHQNRQNFISESFGKRIMIGAVTNFTNPKGILFLTAFFPQWLQPNASWTFAQQAVAMGVVAVVIDTTIMHGYAGLASFIRRLLSNAHSYKMIQTVMGAFLVLIGVGMIVARYA